MLYCKMEKNAFSKAFVSENTSVATVVPPKQYVIETKNDNWPVIRNGREKLLCEKDLIALE